MGKILLAKREAENPYEVEELDLRLYSLEELCYYLTHNVPLIGDDFIDEKLLHFIEVEIGEPDIKEKILRFYKSPSDIDNTLVMLVSEAGYLNEAELQSFQRELVQKRKKNSLERARDKADALMERERYMSAIKVYKPLIFGERDARVSEEFYLEVLYKMASAYGHISSLDQAMECLEIIFDETHDMAVLEKMYCVARLSGSEVPDLYLARIPDSDVRVWRQRYAALEGANKSALEEMPIFSIFFKSKEEQLKDLRSYVDYEKEKYRKMLE